MYQVHGLSRFVEGWLGGDVLSMHSRTVVNWGGEGGETVTLI